MVFKMKGSAFKLGNIATKSVLKQKTEKEGEKYVGEWKEGGLIYSPESKARMIKTFKKGGKILGKSILGLPGLILKGNKQDNEETTPTTYNNMYIVVCYTILNI